MRVTTAAEIERILADPGHQVPAVPAGASGLAWLRSTVSRFVNGDDHARRRSLVGEELAALDPAALRRDARLRAEQALAHPRSGRLELMAAVARPVPLATLAAALGAGDAQLTAADAALTGRAYLSGAGDPEVDAAVERLRAALPRASAEASAAAIALLAQACEATAGLIGNAFVLAARSGDPSVRSADALLEETLRRSSPIRVLTRVSARGERVLLDLDAAAEDRPLAFGGGTRPCPGQAHALALAAGALEPLLLRCELASAPAPLAPDPVLRLPQRLEVIVR